MRLIPVDPADPDPRAIWEAAEALRSGGLVAFPTETVYGLGGNALDAHAVAKIFHAKGRPEFNPLIAHVPDVEQARELTASWPELADALGAAFWPGPLTLVVLKAPHVPGIVTAGLDTVAVRVPAHPVAQALLRAAALPVAAPSANRFTELSPTNADHVAKGLGEEIDLILDGGPTDVGIESTVLDLSGPRPVLLRAGSIGREALERISGPLATAGEITGPTPRPSPGMSERHYSPRARLRVFAPAERREMEEEARSALERGGKVGALLLRPLGIAIQHPRPMPLESTAFARALYATLHELDDAGCDLILVDAPEDTPDWAAVRDRLRRADHRG